MKTSSVLSGADSPPLRGLGPLSSDRFQRAASEIGEEHCPQVRAPISHAPPFASWYMDFHPQELSDFFLIGGGLVHVKPVNSRPQKCAQIRAPPAAGSDCCLAYFLRRIMVSEIPLHSAVHSALLLRTMKPDCSLR